MLKYNYFTVVFFIITSGLIKAQNTLSYNLLVGDSIIVQQKAVQNIVQDMEGQKHEMKNDMEGDFVFIVKSKTDSTYILSMQFTRFKLYVNSNLQGVVVNVDTTNEINDNDIQAKIFAGLTSEVLEMEMFKNGKVLDIHNTEALITKMIENANISNEFTKQVMTESMNKEFGRESLSRSMEHMTLIYPNKPVNVGDTWSNSYGGKLKAENIWTLKAIDSVMKLNAESKIEMFTENPNLTMQLKGRQDTTVIANKETCMSEQITVSSTSEGTTVIAQMSGVQIPTTINSTTTYNIKHYVQ